MLAEITIDRNKSNPLGLWGLERAPFLFGGLNDHNLDRLFHHLVSQLREFLMSKMRRFELQRDIDETGVSGTGIVAEGAEFTNGFVVMQWLTQFSTMEFLENTKTLEALHGHGGKTKVVWID